MVTKSEVRQALATSDTMVVQSLCRLTNKQTAYEKSTRTSTDLNDRGFRKQHGCLVLYAERVWAGIGITQKEIEFLRPRLMIYAGQLAKMANSRQMSLFNS